MAFDRLIDGVDIAVSDGWCLSVPGHFRPSVDGFSNGPRGDADEYSLENQHHGSP